jgi:diguanylate cyclase (GGDEF)-like protein
MMDPETSARPEIAELQAELNQQREANQALNERVLELYTLYNVSRTLSMSLQLGELFDLTMNVIGEAMKLKQFCLMLIDEDSGKLSIQASHGLPTGIGASGMICEEEGVSWKVARSGAPVLVNDIGRESGFVYFRDSGITAGSYLGVPLKRKDGRVIGVINAHKPVLDGFSDADLRLFNSVAEHVAIAIDHALTLKQTRELMHRDELTNLYNRRYFFERFDREVYRAERYQHPISLLMIDIDHFKRLNDASGHLAGDHALKEIARILDEKLRKADVLARYGGEEFLVLLPETNKIGAALVAEKLRAAIDAHDFRQPGGAAPVRLTVTVGVACIPEDTDDASVLLDLADKSLYYGKARGRNQVCLEVPEELGEGPDG